MLVMTVEDTATARVALAGFASSAEKLGLTMGAVDCHKTLSAKSDEDLFLKK